MHGLDITHGNIRMVCHPLSFTSCHRVFILPKRNILVDKDGVACLGGLSSAFVPSLHGGWSDVTTERWFCGIAPELINPGAFGFPHARTTKATDVFAFGMLVWEVG